MAKVFISHSWDDNAISRQLAEYLRRDGAEVWIDYARIQGGDSLPKIISEAIDWCDTLILIWSKSANASFWVGEEWSCAYSLQKRIIPCITDKASLPSLLRSKLCLDFSDFDCGYQDLARTLKLSIKNSRTDSHRKTTPIRTEPEYPPTPEPREKTVLEFKAKFDPKSIKKPNRYSMIGILAFVLVSTLGGYIAFKNGWIGKKLRKEPLALSKSDVKKMLVDYDFFCEEYDWNNQYCNPKGSGYLNDFVLQKNGLVVYDRNSGLIWQQSGSKEDMTYEAAKKYISELNRDRFSGVYGWRIPTLEEAMSLMEPEENKDGIYINAIFDKAQKWIWTSDSFQDVPQAAWVVFFEHGNCGSSYWSHNNYLRAVCTRKLFF